MPIEVTCDACFHSYRVRDEHAGKSIKCKECGAKIRVPEDDEEIPEPARHSSSKSKKSGSRRGKSSGNSSVLLFAGIGGAAVVVIAVVMVLVMNRGPRAGAAVAAAQAAPPPMTPATPLVVPAANPATVDGTPVAAAIPANSPAGNAVPVAANLPATDNTWQVVPDPLPPAFAWPEKVNLNIPIPGDGDLLLCPSTHSPFVAFGFKAYESQGAQMWNLATGKQTGEIKGKPSKAIKRAISPDGKYLAIQVLEKDVHNKMELWSCASGQLIRSFSEPGATSISVMDFGPAESLVCIAYAVVNGKKFRRFTLWDIAKGTIVRQFEPTGYLDHLPHVFSPGRRYFAGYGSDNVVQVHDLTTGKVAGAIKLPRSSELESHLNPQTLRFSPDGNQLVTLMSGSAETRIMVIDIKTGKYDPERDCAFPGRLLSTIDGAASYQGPKLDCLPNRTFLIAGSLWVDGDTGRVVWYLDNGQDRYNHAERIAVPNGLIVREGPNELRRLVVLESPSDAITASLKAIDAEQPGAVRPGQAVSLAFKIGKLLHGTPEETTAALTETFTERLAAVGIEVKEEQSTVLRIDYQEAVGNTLQESIRDRNGPLLGGTLTGKSVQTTQAAVTISWTRDKEKKPLWSKNLVVNPTLLFVQGEVTPEKARTAMFDDLKNTLLAQPIPYFIPDDKSLVPLPGMSVLKDPKVTAGSRDKMRIEAAKKRKKK